MAVATPNQNAFPPLQTTKSLPLSMQFQLSVFHQGSYFGYSISSADNNTFLFQLKSAPPEKTAPQAFTIQRKQKDKWEFNETIDEGFREDVLLVLKRAKL